MTTPPTTTTPGPLRFAKLLNELRTARHLTFLTLGVRAGCDQGYLCKLERGEARSPSREIVTAVAQGLEATPYEHAKLLVTAGFIPIDDEELAETVAVMAARWGLRGVGTSPQARS